jgi:hypothetical protein
MKKIILITLLMFGGRLFSQSAATEDFGDKINFAIGLPKATHTELQLIKEELVQYNQILYSEFFFSDHVLLIECDPHPNKPFEYKTIEDILFKYFGHDHVLRKYVVSFEELKSRRDKTDKFTIK